MLRPRSDCGPSPSRAGVRDPEVPIDPAALVPHYCRPGLHYHVSNGYRPVAGDSCVGGVQHEMLLHPCPGSTWTHHVSHGGWTVLLVLLTLGLAMLAITYFSGPIKRTPAAGRFGGGGGGLSNKPEAALPGWVPAAAARPLGVVVAVALTVLRAARSAALGTVEFVVNAVRRASGAPPVRSGPGYSTRGLGRSSAASGGGLSYDAVGRGGAQPESAAGDDEEVGHSRRRGDGEDDDFGGFGVDGGDDEDDAKQPRFVSAAADPDLLGLGEGMAAASAGAARVKGGLSGAGSGSDSVPVLRPPRSHESSLKARH